MDGKVPNRTEKWKILDRQKPPIESIIKGPECTNFFLFFNSLTDILSLALILVSSYMSTLVRSAAMTSTAVPDDAYALAWYRIQLLVDTIRDLSPLFYTSPT